MKEIELTRGKIALVDDEDYDKVSHLLWFAKKHYTVKGLFYAARSVGPKGKQKTVYIHNFIMNDGKLYDHKDGDGLNNQRSNLREATVYQNNLNTRKRCDNTSGFKGIYWVSREQRWVASFRHEGRTIYVGYFKDKLEAAKAYDEEIVKYHGEFAKTNEMLGLYSTA